MVYFLNFKQQITSSTKRGSATVEAALVIPLLILIIALIICAGIKYEKHVEESSNEHIQAADEVLVDDLTNIEDVVRGRWVLQ